MPDHNQNDRLKRALERTAPAAQFGAEHVGQEPDQTPRDRTEGPAAQQFLNKTAVDPSQTRTRTAELTSFGVTADVPAEIRVDMEQAGQRFDVSGEVGRGATATVYSVSDRALGRTIALKLLRGAGAGKAGARQRFVHEARVTAMLEHPNIVPVYDIGVTPDRRAYFLMKNVSGVSLGDAIRLEQSGAEPPEQCRTVQGKLEALLKVCDALAFAHSRGYVHQDVKPDNIMLGGYGEVLVLDWGCALARDTPEADGRALYGTPAYMSPEQARRERADERSDVYCVGATMYHTLTGQHPTWVDDPAVFWEMKRNGELSPLPAEAEAKVPGPLLAVARKALEPDPSQRYQSMTELRAALVEYQRHEESAAMAQAAIDALDGAAARGDYQAFAESAAALRQALRMWPGNEHAAEGLLDTRRRHALCALDKGDIELAASLVDNTPAFAEIRQRIEREQALLNARRRTAHRTRTVVFVLGLAVAAAMVYFAADYLRTFGKWQQVYYEDFTRPGADTRALAQSYQQTEEDGMPPAPGPRGLPMTPNNVLWLTQAREAGDVRVEARVRWVNSVDGFEMFLNARREPQARFWQVPAGYSCQFGGWKGLVNFISRNPRTMDANVGNAVAHELRPGRVYRLWFQRSGERVELYVDGARILSVTEPLPLSGENLHWIGLRNWGVEVDLLSLGVWRMGSAAKLDPVAIGDAFVREGLLPRAVRQYVRAVEDHPRTRIAERALVRAYLACGLMDSSYQRTRANARARLQSEHRNSGYWPVLYQADCEYEWRSARYDSALALAARSLEQDPDSRAALQLLTNPPAALPIGVGERLLALVGRTTGVSSIDISGMGVSDLSPLSRLRLVSLNCADNAIADLAPLHGMPLRMLVATGNRIESLAPLGGMPLQTLDVENNYIADLAPLRGMRLMSLNVRANRVTSLEPLAGMSLAVLTVLDNRITSLEPLRGMQLQDAALDNNLFGDLSPLAGQPIRRLSCSGSSVGDLGPLAGMPLTFLNCAGNPITDLSPLKGAPIAELNAYACRLSDLSPLRGMPLRTLRIGHNPGVTLEPLAGMALTELGVEQCSVHSLEPLRGMPLQSLSAANNPVRDLRPLEGMTLTALTCVGCPLNSLRPFEEHPPDVFTFDSVADRGDERLVRRWLAAGDTARAAQTLALKAVRRGRYAELLPLASRYAGHSYLYVPARSGWQEAQRIAEAAGGYLVAPSTPAEYGYVSGLIPGRQTGVWLGIRWDGSVNRWESGEPLGWSLLNMSSDIDDPRPKYMINSTLVARPWFTQTADERNGLVIEWDR